MALPLVLSALAAMLGLALVAQLAAASITAARAQAVADATALAVAIDGPVGKSLARGADDVSVDGGRGSATVTVVLDGQQASAAAIAQTSQSIRRLGLAPSMVASLARAESLLGFTLSISSGYRSPAHQRRLWDERADNPYPVARPGTSMHERGLAVDIQLAQVGALASVAADAGLCHPLPETDPVHFVVCPIPD
ncbi:MAG: M15 family metallopeptidase [Actinomycetota bacterium]|nr:M15 family metallopeptidase [Actinomycetota bacterium]